MPMQKASGAISNSVPRFVFARAAQGPKMPLAIVTADRDEATFLLARGCDQMQGFLFSPALAPRAALARSRVKPARPS